MTNKISALQEVDKVRTKVGNAASNLKLIVALNLFYNITFTHALSVCHLPTAPPNRHDRKEQNKNPLINKNPKKQNSEKIYHNQKTMTLFDYISYRSNEWERGGRFTT